MSLRSTLSDIADAIRSKTGKTDLMAPTEMAMEISDIEADRLPALVDGTISGTVTITSTNYIREKIFSDCDNLTRLELYHPNDTRIYSEACSYSGLVEVDGPTVDQIEYSAFAYCSNLEMVNFPALHILYSASYVFAGTAIEEVNFPALQTIPAYAFQGGALVKADLDELVEVGTYGFNGATHLTALIIRRTDRIATLEATNGITGTPIHTGNGYIYVPSALIDTYKSATNWSVFASKFRALEDYTVDGTVTGELDPTKI